MLEVFQRVGEAPAHPAVEEGDEDRALGQRGQVVQLRQRVVVLDRQQIQRRVGQRLRVSRVVPAAVNV